MRTSLRIVLKIRLFPPPLELAFKSLQSNVKTEILFWLLFKKFFKREPIGRAFSGQLSAWFGMAQV